MKELLNSYSKADGEVKVIIKGELPLIVMFHHSKQAIDVGHVGTWLKIWAFIAILFCVLDQSYGKPQEHHTTNVCLPDINLPGYDTE